MAKEEVPLEIQESYFCPITFLALPPNLPGLSLSPHGVSGASFSLMQLLFLFVLKQGLLIV